MSSDDHKIRSLFHSCNSLKLRQITMNSGYRQQSSDPDRLKNDRSTVSARPKLVLISKTEKDLPSLPPSHAWRTHGLSRGECHPPKRVAFAPEEPSGDAASKTDYTMDLLESFQSGSKSVMPLKSTLTRQRPVSYMEAAARKRSDTAVNTSNAVQSAFDPSARRPASPTQQLRDPVGLRKTALTNAARERRPSTVAYPPRPKSYHSAASYASLHAPFVPRPRFAPGELINAAHVSVKDPKVHVADAKSVTGSNVGDVVGKYRYMIVLAVYQSHMLTVPIYTHGGFGLCNKPDWYRGHHMQFLQGGAKDEVTNYTPYSPLRYYSKPGKSSLMECSCVWATRPINVGFDQEISRIGWIRKDDFGRLSNLFKNLMLEGIKYRG